MIYFATTADLLHLRLARDEHLVELRDAEPFTFTFAMRLKTAGGAA